MMKKILISVFALGFIAAVLSVYALEKKHDLIAEIRNEQPDSNNNSAIRIRLFNNGNNSYEQFSFCYQFTAKKKFVFENDWYLPHLNYNIDTLSDTTFQIHFWVKDGYVFEPGTYFPNEAGIVFGLHYEDWSAWDFASSFSFSKRALFTETENLFVATSAECAVDESDNYHLIMGYDLDKNGVRDDLDSLIDANLNEPEHRAAYRYFAKKSLEQWKAFYYNQQMTYEELYEYEIYSSLGIDFIKEYQADKNLKFDFFVIRLTNTKERLRFEHSIDLKFAGQLLPAIVLNEKRYKKQSELGLTEFQKILEKEREGLK